jgi:hypothetical protein
MKILRLILLLLLVGMGTYAYATCFWPATKTCDYYTIACDPDIRNPLFGCITESAQSPSVLDGYVAYHKTTGPTQTGKEDYIDTQIPCTCVYQYWSNESGSWKSIICPDWGASMNTRIPDEFSNPCVN